jgi:TolA-binding protein
MQIGDVERALRVADKFAASNPNSPLADDLALRVGDILYNSGDRVRAAAAYQLLVDRHPSSELVPAALYWKGRAYLEERDTSAAIAAWEEVLKHDRKSPFAPTSLYQIGLTRLAVADTTGALAQFVVVARDYPASEIAFEASLKEASLRRAMGNPDAALKLLGTIATEGQGDIRFRASIEIARCLIDTERYDEAYQTALKIATERTDATGAEAQFVVGEALAKLGQPAKAIEAFLKIKYIYSGQAEWIARGQIEGALLKLKSGEKEEARRILTTLARDFGDDRWGKEATQILSEIR